MVILDIATKYYTIADYLEMEDVSETRHEFHNGVIKDMAGGILPHNVVKLRLSGKLDQLLMDMQVSHMALNSDTKVRIEAYNRFVYPGVTISDGTPEYYTTPDGKVRRNTIINPMVIFEVLSEDTRSFDKGDKFELYSAVPGFREYVLIEPESVWVKSLYLVNPEDNLWRHEILTDRNATLTVHSLGLKIPLDDLYKALDKLPTATA
jgi:Uma2 family endonuclease